MDLPKALDTLDPNILPKPDVFPDILYSEDILVIIVIFM